MIQKILLTLLVIGVVWFGWKYISRQIAAPKSRPRVSGREKQGGQSMGEVQEMVKCRACDAYVPKGDALNCGRKDCPW
ncbi:hypothetical protein [Telmatospirillum sp. J64-1]|uniref:hypothetical protein n=1 Tax=Telmatospirillum sp. J64-1 TaxID=2502183 RepID=UPI00115CB90D|nr:hypothetical protein [Telmatospirillum sp. J64-1]